MNKPDVEETISGYRLNWPDKSIEISVSRLKQHTDGRTTGWLVIKTTGETPLLLHQADFNFSSTQSLDRLAKYIAIKYESADWPSILEQLRYYILERLREGEPVIELYSGDYVEPSSYLIHPIIPEGQPTIIFGEPAVGKSQTALILFLCLILPWYDNPLGLVVPTRGVRAFYADYESNDKLTKRRLKYLQEGMNIPPVTLPYRRCLLPFSDDIERFKKDIDAFKTEVLFIDSQAQAVGGDIMNPERAVSYFEALRKLNITTVTLAQTQKDPEKQIKTILGPGIFSYYARSIWELRKSQEEGSNKLNLALYHRKSNEDALSRPICFSITFNENKTFIKRQNLEEVPDFFQRMALKKRIYEELRGGPLTKNELAEVLVAKESVVSKDLSQMKVSGTVVKLGDNKWGLKSWNE